jgi:peptidoglycan L-alanyl-D-glutamate endopeptidase CwlK
MPQNLHSLPLALFCLTLFGVNPKVAAQSETSTGSRTSVHVSGDLRYGPGSVYARIPARDEFGRDQLGMFRTWNPDPVRNHETNLKALNPVLAKVVRKAQTDNPGQRFVIGSGKRNRRLQRMAVTWGWSRTQDSRHRLGNAVDLWLLDWKGRVYFDWRGQNEIAFAMQRAATELGVPIRWGGYFHGFKDLDRSHFELSPR